MAAVGGFWSYVHDDDDAEEGRIVALAKRIVAEFELQTGKGIELFLDRDSIQWGDRWRKVVDETLADVAFFIPVMTPRYFQSEECRRELNVFIERATRLGVKELVLPLYYVTHPPLDEDSPDDPLVALLKDIHWEDWRKLRVEDPASSPHRQGVRRLVDQLVAANARADKAAAALTPEQSKAKSGVVVGSAVATIAPAADEATPDGQAPGTLDLLAGMETAYPKWEATLNAIGSDIALVGEIMTRGATDIDTADSRGRGFAGRLAITRRVSRELSEPAERIWSASKEFVLQMHEVDEGTRLLIRMAADEAGEDSASTSEVCELFATLRTLAATTEDSLESVKIMIDNAGELEGMSRDLRPPLRRLRDGLTLTLEAREVTREWVRLIEDTGIECDDEPTLASDDHETPHQETV